MSKKYSSKVDSKVTKSIESTPHFTVQDLVECYDDIPLLTKKINEADNPVTRFQVIEPNSSYSIAYALRGNEKIDITSQKHTNQIQRMANHAQKVLDHLASIPKDENDVTVSQNAQRARDKLNSLQKKGIDITKFYQQYDVQRNGQISYKDFSDTLLSLSTGIGREDAMFLASNLDKHKKGMLDYRNILNGLDDLTHHNGSSKPIPPSSSSSSTSSLGNIANNRLKQSQKNTLNTTNPYFSETISFNNILDSLNSIEKSSPKPKENQNSQLSGKSNNQKDNEDNFTSKVQMLDPNYKETSLTQEGGPRGYRGYFNRFQKTCPYYVDQTIDEKKAQVQAKPRSKSTPVARPKALINHLKDSKEESRSEKQSDPLPLEKPNSSHTSLKEALQKTPSKKTNSENVSEITPTQNPMKILKDKVLQKRQAVSDTERKLLENQLVRQVGGTVNNFRKVLKDFDISQSGVLNYEEFRAGLMKTGVNFTNEQYLKLFYNYSESTQQFNQNLVDPLTNQSKVVNIESFVSKVTSRTSTPALSYVVEDIMQQGIPSSEYAHRSQEVRVMKKVFDTLNKPVDYHRFLKNLHSKTNESLSMGELKEVLHYAGTNLSDIEFNILSESIGKDKVTLVSLEDKMRSTIQNHSLQQESFQKAKINSNRRYKHAFKSSIVLGDGKDDVNNTKFDKAKKDVDLKWAKVKLQLQANHPKILNAFLNADMLKANPTIADKLRNQKIVDYNSVQSLDMTKLERKLHDVGIVMNKDDLNTLKTHLCQTISENEKFPSKNVSLGDFCQTVGIPIKINRDDGIKKEIQLVNPEEVGLRDEGTFSSSMKSILNSDVYSSRFTWDTNKTFIKEKQPIHLQIQDAETFWSFPNSVEDPMKLPYPQRDDLRNPGSKERLDETKLIQGVVSLKDFNSSDQIKKILMGSNNNKSIQGGKRSVDDIIISSHKSDDMRSETYRSEVSDRRSEASYQSVSRKRSTSAPPTRSRTHTEESSNSLASFQRNKLSNETNTSTKSNPAPSASIQPPTISTGPSPEMMNSLKNWATKPLSDKYLSKFSQPVSIQGGGGGGPSIRGGGGNAKTIRGGGQTTTHDDVAKFFNKLL